MRSKRDASFVHDKAAVAAGIGCVYFRVAGIRRTDINNRSEPGLSLFFLDVRQCLICRRIIVALRIELAVFHVLSRLSREDRPYTNARATVNKTGIMWLPPFQGSFLLSLAISKKPEGFEPPGQRIQSNHTVPRRMIVSLSKFYFANFMQNKNIKVDFLVYYPYNKTVFCRVLSKWR